MNTELLDRAYRLQRDAYFTWWQESWADDDALEYDEANAELIQRLITQFPNANGDDIPAALVRAMRLINSAESIQSKRDLEQQYNETPAAILQRQCPGFSDTVYTNAENFGYYLTR